MKRIFLLLTVCLFSIYICADEIDVNYAKEKALSFCKSADKASSLGKVRKTLSSQLSLAYTATTNRKKDFYVFNKSDRGFIIVTADDVIGEKVLAYSDEDNFNYDELPENAKWWLSQYSEQIEYARKNGAKSIAATTAEEPFEVIMPPLLGDVSWGQSAPYNTYTPILNNEQCVTGCVATAMAQVMYFHNWPLQGKGSNSYNWEKGGKTLTADFSNSVYEWNNMMPTYNTYTSAQGNAVARLMSDAGLSVNMNYGPSSGAYSENAVISLKNYFGYSTDVKIRMKGSTTNQTTWNNLLKTELNAMHPVYYSGSSSSGAHAFVCDGYASGDYFHFNFGWNGKGNGYFLSTNPDGYSKSQDIITGIHPANDANRKSVNGIIYNILCDNEVAVAYSARMSYSGSIVIPSEVTIDGKDYTVTRIGCAAFTNCKNLTSVTIPSTVKIINGNAFFGCPNLEQIIMENPIPITVCGTTFDAQLCNATQLVVPSGSISSYSTAVGWKNFATIADAEGSIIEWNEWENFGYGMGRYVLTSIFVDDQTYDNLPVKIRSSKSDVNTCQILVEGWGYNGNESLIIGFNKLTNKCTVEKQLFGYVTTSGKLTYISDMPNYSKSYTYTKYPCTFDPDKGLFKLYVAYGSTSWSGVDTLYVPGSATDFKLEVLNATETTELDNDTARQTLALKVGKDIAELRTAVVKTKMSAAEITDYANSIASGAVPYTVATTRDSIEVTYPTSGKYTVILCGIKTDGSLCALTNYQHTYVAVTNWASLGSAKYHEDLVPSEVYPKLKEYDYSVDVEYNTKHAGLYRIRNPYGKSYPMNSTGKYTSDSYDTYLEIHAENPHAVYLTHVQDMNVTFNAKHGGMVLSSVAGKAIAEGSTLDEQMALGVCGSLDDCIITFPANTILVRYPLYSAEWIATNTHGTFSLDLTGLIIPTPTVLPGDADEDGAVTVADITAIASYILGTIPERFNLTNADADADGTITVADITATATIILGN